eukprot:COSAG01_NODE_5353_length_4315_cov_32.988852_6_plen_119_part_00
MCVEYLLRTRVLSYSGLIIVAAMQLALCKTLGLDVHSLRYICVKSTGHFRSGFGAVAGSIYNVKGGGILPASYAEMKREGLLDKLGRQMWPLDVGMDWSPRTSIMGEGDSRTLLQAKL